MSSGLGQIKLMPLALTSDAAIRVLRRHPAHSVYSILKAAVRKIGFKLLRTNTYQALEDEVQQLNHVIREYQLKLERKPDYQTIMAQDQIRAGMADVEPEFLELYIRCREYTMTSWERLYALHKAVQYIVANAIPGDLVECGVWRGGSMRLCRDGASRRRCDRQEALSLRHVRGHDRANAIGRRPLRQSRH